MRPPIWRASRQQRAAMGPEFLQFSGEDATALASWRMAGTDASRSPPTSRRGCAPNSRTPACAATSRRRSTLQDRLMPLHDAMFFETNPGPVKYAASRLGLCTADMRLPMVPLHRRCAKDRRCRDGEGWAADCGRCRVIFVLTPSARIPARITDHGRPRRRAQARRREPQGPARIILSPTPGRPVSC